MEIQHGIIVHWSKRYRIDPFLVKAIITIESSHNTWANRYEPNWRWLLNVKWWARRLRESCSTERMNQMTSWGPMQVMGTVARELGHTGFLPSLCDPNIGIDYGCRKFRQCMDRVGDDVPKALSKYNSGRPNSKRGRAYARKVLIVYQSNLKA